MTTPVDRDGPEPPGPGLVEDQPPDDGKVATVDPLIGLLGMQVRLSSTMLFSGVDSGDSTSLLGGI